MTAMDIALSRLRNEHEAFQAVARFKTWLELTDRGYLADGLGRLPPGPAFREILNRAGITEISEHADIAATMPRLMQLISERCPAKKRIVQ